MKTLLIQFKSLVMVALFFGATFSNAQKAEAPENSYNVGAKINEMTLTQGGTLVAAANDGLVGISPEQSQPIFTFNDFGKLKPEETEFVPSSPYIVVSQGANSKFAGIARTKRAVIDYMLGRVLFNSEAENWKQVFTFDVFLPQNQLVISGLKKEGGMAEKSTPKVAVYNLEDGKLAFDFFLMEPGKVTMKNYAVTGKPILLKESIIIPTSQGLISKSHSGATLWENKMKNINWMVADETEKEIYAFEGTNNGKNTRIHKVGSNGAELWQDDRKVKGNVSNFQILPKGLAVVSDVAPSGGKGLNKLMASKAQSHIAFLSASSGEDLWDKAPKTKGYVQHFYVMEDGILFGIQEGGINKISFEGETLFKKPLKTGENILTMAHSPQGLIYITSEDANIVDLNTGEEVWGKPLKYKRADYVTSTFDESNNRYLISAKDVVYAVDASLGNVSELAEYDFEEKESPTNMEIRDGGILLTSDQNMSMLNFDGSQKFHEYFKSPSKSGVFKVIAGAIAVASTAMAASHAYQAGANRNQLGDYNRLGRDHDRASKIFSAIGGAAFEAMAQRFKATAATENAQFILTKLDSGVGLVRVNKDSGEVDKEILLNDKKPEYQVDEFAGYLFYKASDDTVYSYNLKQ